MKDSWRYSNQRPPDPPDGKECSFCRRVYSKKIRIKGKMVCPFCYDKGGRGKNAN